MSLENKLEKKKTKLQELKEFIEEGIDSQEKYLNCLATKDKLTVEIEKLEKLKRKNKKVWIDMGNGWKKRINLK